MDIAKRRLWRNGEIVPLAPKVFDLLVVLIEQSGKTLEKDELMQRVWPDTNVEENNLTQNIYTLRKILGEKRSDSRYIATVSGIGYRFVAEVRRIPLADEEIEIHEKTEARVIVTETVIENDNREEAVHHDLSSASATPLLPAASLPRFGNNKILGGLLALVIVLVAALTYFIIQQWRARPAIESFGELTVTPLTRTGTAMSVTISPDGKHIEYVVKEGNRQSVWLRQLVTGGTQQIVPPEEAIYYGLNFSHDGNYLFFVKRKAGDKENVLYKMPWLGGIPTKLAAGMESFISVSPDDRRLAFIRQSANESALMMINADGSEERRLAVRPITDYFKVPAWSPSGQTIACTTGSGEAYDKQNSVVEINLSDGQQKPLTAKKWHWTRWVEWLPDGSGLLLTAEGDNAQPAQIWHLSYPSGQVRQVTNDSQTYFGLSLTADAKTLAATQTQLLSEIWLTTLGADHAAKKLTFGTGFYSDVCFAADGRIIYSSKESGNDDIWRMNADGTEKQQLTTDSNTDLHQTVSPDGRYLVFASNRSGAFNLWRMQSDGSNPVRLTSGRGEKFPHFSPDGQWVIYNDVASDGSYYSLWKIPIAGGPSVRVAEQTDKAAVSPNGKHIAYFASESQDMLHHKIVVMPFTGGPLEHSFDVPPDLFPIREVHWAKDSRSLFYSAEQQGFSDIWQQPLDGNPPKRVTNLKMEGRLLFDLSPDGKQFVLTRRLWTYDVLLLTHFH